MVTVYTASMMAIDKLTDMTYNCSILGEVKYLIENILHEPTRMGTFKYTIMVRFLDTSWNLWYDCSAVEANEPRPPQLL